MPPRVPTLQSAIRPFRDAPVQPRREGSSGGAPELGSARSGNEMGFRPAQDNRDVARRGGMEAAVVAATPGSLGGGSSARTEQRHGPKACRNSGRDAI